jgi:hypothetical protein
MVASRLFSGVGGRRQGSDGRAWRAGGQNLNKLPSARIYSWVSGIGSIFATSSAIGQR